jgi:cytochrome c-type biogenesis protein CcmH
VAVIAMPVAAFGFYLLVGSPGYPDQPLAARVAPAENTDIAALVAAVEERLAAAPDDGAGWDVIAPVYLRLGRSAEALTAYANAIRILGATAERETGVGESITALSGGLVTPEARAAFERARGLAPQNPLPRFYLALALQQEGKDSEALAAWQALLADAPADASWIPAVREQIAALEQAEQGPTAEDVEAATSLPPEEQAAMIEGMVASLASRLADDGSDAAGWARLVRSYMVLGRRVEAEEALAKARIALEKDSAGLAEVEEVARETGLVEGGAE